ncbi:EF-hand domain-containing protein [Pseudohoeflea suaedae]|nr:EF-hand domain-containing protein [Pseudohoeflea suaedae]
MTKTLTTFAGLAALLIAMPAYAQDTGPEDGAMKHRKMEHGGRMMGRFDADDDGAISMEEFMEMGPGMIEGADADADGEITFDEMKAAWEARREERMKKRFLRRFDVDGDGKVSVSELKDRQEKRFALLDANNDGVISKQEFRKGYRELGWGKDGRKGDRDHRRGEWHKGWDD